MSWEIVGEVGTKQPKEIVSQKQEVGEVTQSREIPVLDTLTQGRASGLLDKFVNQSAMERVVAGSVGGITAMAAADKETEEALPFAMGTIGGVLGGMLGHPNLGVGVGTGIGDAEKQWIDKMKGQADTIDIGKSLLTGAGAGLLSKGGELIAKTAGQTFNLIPERARVAFYDKVKDATDLGYKALVRNYGRAVNNLVEQFPDKRIALNGTMERISSALEGVVDDAGQAILPQIKRAVKNNPRLANVVDDPSKAIGLTLKEANDLKGAVSSTVKSLIKRVQKGGTATPQERGIFEILNSFDSEITKSFPQMRQVNELYSAGKHAYDLARPQLNPGAPVEAAIMSKPTGLFGLGGSKFMGSTGGKLALKDIMSETKVGAKIYHAAELSHNLNRAADAVGRLAEIGAGGYALTKLGIRDERE